MKAILIDNEFWENSHLSVARYSGGVSIDGHEYIICDKRGLTIFECSIEAENIGREKAIGAGEPAPLVREDFIPLLKKLGLEAFLAILRDNECLDDKSIKKVMKNEIKALKRAKKERKQQHEHARE